MGRVLTFIMTTLSLLCLAASVASAKTPTPTTKALSLSRKSTKKHEATLLKKYRINLGYQTAFNRRHQVWVYNFTGSKAVQESLDEAQLYWNEELGRSVFNVGTYGYRTMTVKFTNQTNHGDHKFACWSPATRTLKINRKTYEKELNDIRRYMKRHYLAKQHDPLGEDLIFEKINTNLAPTARDVEYARILAHEFGHVLGLAHSTNRRDLMYTGLGFSDIYEPDQVGQMTIWNNPLTQTDVARGRLGLRLARFN